VQARYGAAKAQKAEEAKTRQTEAAINEMPRRETADEAEKRGRGEEGKVDVARRMGMERGWW
jgi:hypothetical protein